MSLRRHVPAGNLPPPPPPPPNILNLGAPNILNLPTPMQPGQGSTLPVTFCFVHLFLVKPSQLHQSHAHHRNGVWFLWLKIHLASEHYSLLFADQGPRCSKQTMSLVKVSLQFQTVISNIPQYFLLKKKVRSFGSAKASLISPTKISVY